jgi:hypothetical protein
MDYYLVHSRDNDTCFYYDKEGQIQLEYCLTCGLLTNREEAIEQGIAIYRKKGKYLISDTWDGETIVSDRFIEIYNKYNLKGLDFIALPKSPHYYLLRCNNIVRYDHEYNTNVYLKHKCPTCNQWHEVCPMGVFNIMIEDEAVLEPDTFYCSDIFIGEKVARHRLLYATDNIPDYFKTEKGRIFFNKIKRTH